MIPHFDEAEEQCRRIRADYFCTPRGYTIYSNGLHFLIMPLVQRDRTDLTYAKCGYIDDAANLKISLEDI